jgi:hypothetical protein
VFWLCLYFRASVSVVVACVWFLRRVPFQFAWALRPGPLGPWPSLPSFGLEHLWLAHAPISVPSTEKYSLDGSPAVSASAVTSMKNDSTTSCLSSRSALLENTEQSQIT